MEIIKPFVLVLLAAALLYGCGANRDWATASRESAGIAPDPALTERDKLGAKTVSQWRRDYLRDWQIRMDRARMPKPAGK